MRVLVLTGMYPTAQDPAFGCFVAEQVEALRQAEPGLRCDIQFFNGRASRLNYIRAIRQLRRRVRSGSFDVVHAHYGLAGLVAATQRSVPVVLTLHGSDVHVPWQRVLTRLAVRSAHTVIVVSERMKPLVQDAAGRDVRVIPCGVDPGRFHPASSGEARARLGWPSRAPLLLFPGDPARRVKGYDLFCEVLRRVRSAGFSIHEVALRGIPPMSVPDVMNASNVMVMTSRTEGSPMAIKEAMACNLPIVSVDVGDVAGLVSGTANCEVVPHRKGAPATMAAAVVRVLERQERSDGRMRVAHLFHREIAGQVLDVYRHAASEGRTGLSHRPEGSRARAS